MASPFKPFTIFTTVLVVSGDWLLFISYLTFDRREGSFNYSQHNSESCGEIWTIFSTSVDFGPRVTRLAFEPWRQATFDTRVAFHAVLLRATKVDTVIHLEDLDSRAFHGLSCTLSQ